MPLKRLRGLPIATSPEAADEHVLDVPWVGQSPQRLWCWAACAAMLHRFFFRDPRPIEACDVVAGVKGSQLGHPCANPDRYDQAIPEEQVSKVLASVRVRCPQAPRPPLTREEVRAEILAGRPLLVMAQSAPCDKPPGSTRHLFIVCGWAETSEGDVYVQMQDPADANRADERWTFSALERYNDWGCWTGAWAGIHPDGSP